MKIRESVEDDLEMMRTLKEKHGYIRSAGIAKESGVKKPSVSYATKRMKENGYITMDKGNLIEPTASGMEIASRIDKCHKLLTGFLVALGADEETARADACGIEQNLSEKSFAAICTHIKMRKET